VPSPELHGESRILLATFRDDRVAEPARRRPDALFGDMLKAARRSPLMAIDVASEGMPPLAHMRQTGVPMDDQPDEQLIPLAIAGDRDAWNGLIARHDQRVLVTLLARGVRVDRAREITQETWARLIAHQQAGRLARLELPGLAIKQAIFLCTDDARRTKRERIARAEDEKDEIAMLSDSAPSIEARLVARSELERASEALDQCSPTAQRVFDLVYDEPSMPHAETARRVGLSVQRVRQTICEVRARLRKVLDDDRAHVASAQDVLPEASDE
jgi:RNA polymerase sigma-70 factor (ECF subfamily)